MQIPSGPEAMLHIKAGYMTAADPSMSKMNEIPLATKGGSIHDHWYSAAIRYAFPDNVPSRAKKTLDRS